VYQFKINNFVDINSLKCRDREV